MRQGGMPNSEHATSGAGAAPANGVGPPNVRAGGNDAPLLVDVPFPEAMLPSWRDLVAVVIFIIILAVLGRALWWYAPPEVTVYCLFGAALFLIVLWAGIFAPRSSAAGVLVTLANNRARSVQEAVAEALRRALGVGAPGGLQSLVQWLGTHDAGNVTIRALRSSDFYRIEPISVPFEPQPLNAARSSLITVHERLGATGISARAADDPGGRSPDLGLMRLVTRNITLSGGSFVTGTFVGLVVFWGTISVLTHQFSGPLIGALSMLPGMLLHSIVMGRFKHHWLVLPSGIIVRRAKWSDARWQIHLFDRRKSALCVCRLRQKQWGAFVADGQSSSRAIMTKEEIDFLLSAWFSPLSAPSPDQLADLE